MNRFNWFFFVAFVAMSIMQALAVAGRDKAIEDRDAARQETREVAALYNGVLIGRGCEVLE